MVDPELAWLEDDLYPTGVTQKKRLKLSETPGLHLALKQDEVAEDIYEARIRGFDESEVGEILKILDPKTGKSVTYKIITKNVKHTKDPRFLTTKFVLEEVEPLYEH